MSIYTYSERTVKKYTFQDAINNANGRINQIRPTGLISKHSPKEAITLEQVNQYADQMVRGF